MRGDDNLTNKFLFFLHFLLSLCELNFTNSYLSPLAFGMPCKSLVCFMIIFLSLFIYKRKRKTDDSD